MDGPHISPRLGNFLLMALTGGVGAIAILATAVWLSGRNVPVLSHVADAGLDLVRLPSQAQTTGNPA